MAYDAGFDIVVPISKMTADQVPKLVQDAIFSRKPNAPTTFFIGGSNEINLTNYINLLYIIDTIIPTD